MIRELISWIGFVILVFIIFLFSNVVLNSCTEPISVPVDTECCTDTLIVDTVYRDTTIIQRVIQEPTPVLDLVSFGGVPNLLITQDDVLAAALDSLETMQQGTLRINPGIWAFKDKHRIKRKYLADYTIDARDAQIRCAGDGYLFTFIGDEPNKDVNSQVQFIGGDWYLNDSDGIRLEAGYGCSFDDMRVFNGDTFLYNSFSMGTMINRLYLTKTNQGIVVDNLLTEYQTASNYTTVQNSRMYGENSNGFFHVYGSYGCHSNNVIVEGRGVHIPFLFDFATRGTDKIATITCAHIETECDTVIAFRNTNGGELSVMHSNFTGNVGDAVIVSTHGNTTAAINFSWNVFPNTARFHGNYGADYWYFNGWERTYNKEYISFVGGNPFWWYVNGQK